MFDSFQTYVKTLYGKHKAISILIGACLLWFLYGVVANWYQNRKLVKEALEDVVFPVSVIYPKEDEHVEKIALPGNIMAWNQAYIYSRVSGYITDWYTDYGASVEAGQLMAKIWTPMLNAEYGQAKMDMQSAKAIYDLADITVKRYEKMKASQAVAIQTITVKEAMYRAKKAEYNAAKYRVNTLKARLQFRHIVAPFSGRVISRNINIGDYVSRQGEVTEQTKSADHLFIVADIQKVRLFVSVPERFSPFLTPGFTADVVFPQFPNRHFTANFLTSAHAFEPETRTVVTEFVMENKDHSIWPGSYATVTLSAKNNTPILSIPTTAMIFDANGTRVAVVEKDNTVHFKEIVIDKFEDTFIAVAEGLSKTDKVINTPNLALLEGSKVKVVKPAAGYFENT